MSTRLTRTKLGIGGADSGGRGRARRGGGRGGPRADRSAGPTRWRSARWSGQVLVVVERGDGGDLGGGGDGPGLLAPPEPVRSSRARRPRSRPGGRGRRRSWSSTAGRSGSSRSRRPGSGSARPRRAGTADTPRRRPSCRSGLRSIRPSSRARSQARPVGLLGWPVQKIPVAPSGSSSWIPAQDVLAPDLGASGRSGPRSGGIRRRSARPGGPAGRSGSPGLAGSRPSASRTTWPIRLISSVVPAPTMIRSAGTPWIFGQPLDQPGRARLGVAVDGLGGLADRGDGPGGAAPGRSAGPRSRAAAGCPA